MFFTAGRRLENACSRETVMYSLVPSYFIGCAKDSGVVEIKVTPVSTKLTSNDCNSPALNFPNLTISCPLQTLIWRYEDFVSYLKPQPSNPSTIHILLSFIK